MIDNLLNKYIEKGNALQKSIFINNFKDLYKLDIFKPGLDLILSESEIGNVTFELNIIDDLVQLRGCCLTHERNVFNKVLNTFVKTYKHKITLQKLNVGVLMHEMAHALEKQGRISLSQGFDQAIGNDLKGIGSAPHTIKYAVDKIMYQDLKLYPENQQSSELFARLFQMLAMSKEIGHFDDEFQFRVSDCEEFFKSSTMWIRDVFNVAAGARVADYISSQTAKIKFTEANTRFTRKFTTESEKKSWSSGASSKIKSNFED
ncbi:MAG: hypothetical protein HON23_03735 [Rickettsiales bacterium]|jgi:hypothetical protein|nr:hypothetical protein [Rickettsiales bacterium]